MFARLPDAASDPVAIVVDGETVVARAGDSVAAALLAAGRVVLRTTSLSGAPRGAHCLMGACFDCLVTIDGVPGQQACRVSVAPGMRVLTGQCLREVG
jgi:predicted molibdopterin-dependent oxidoreductase YjgC